ncbi:hypothetical protein P280DRAFT_262861 [Massarina eburnea CBS 473.64]|uniref:Major facilitator superfamily transporter n=1 Tax=Massarina eburnea CBS 473.64 TaxID=1395130 RepID=A0A6A6S6D7_9PLEO|nr:hypothetical protein P280DRAFT_262861 [Massarina eburnea CBS 473.64]
MLAFRPLQVAKRKLQSYNNVPGEEEDVENAENADNAEKAYDSDESSSYVSSSSSSPYSSRVSSGVNREPILRKRSASRSEVRAYSHKDWRRFTRWFGLAVGSVLLLFMYFLLSRSWASMRYAELGLHKSPPPKAVWESFPFLSRYHGGIRTLTSREENKPEYPRKEDIDPEMAVSESKETPKEKRVEGAKLPDSIPFNPYPDYNSLTYVEKYGPVEECYLDANDTVSVPSLRAYQGVTDGTPDNIMGSYEMFGLRNDVCFERFGRLGPYGLGYSKKRGGSGAAMEGDREGIEAVWQKSGEIDYRDIKWGEALDRCLTKNQKRFKPATSGRNNFFQTMATKGPAAEVLEGDKVESRAPIDEPVREQPKASHNTLLPRTAVLIRTWWDYVYDDEDIMYLRSLISELSLASGAEYQVHFLIHVKDDNKQIWADEKVYQEVLEKSLPAEFAGMGTLWSERQMGLIYGGLEESMYRNLPVHGAYRSAYMPVTYFAHQHPEYDFFWHWEMDVRYTGHYYHLFKQVGEWADKQPRKGLWERNARFYVPAVHGPWEDFTHMVRVQTEHGTNSKANSWSSNLPANPHMPEPETQKPEKPIWGPVLPQDYPDIQIDEAVKPKTTMLEDKNVWGVGEAADLIVLNPLFDPEHTNWILAEDVTGYNTTRGLPPRRTAINTSGRLSRRLLETMHREQSHQRHTMFSEMWPGTVALHYGLKAVYAPHPVFIDRKWPVQYLAAIFNNGRNGASGGARLSVFSDERQHNFLGTTWYYHAGHAPNLWKRWLGYKVDNDGGEQEELAREGRMCLPAMLLHPVKQVDLVQEKMD